jgi:hypothetical protein
VASQRSARLSHAARTRSTHAEASSFMPGV